MATKIVYVYDKDTKEYKYPREIDVESSIENSTEIPVPEVMYGKTIFTGNGWVTQTKEEWLASLPKAEIKPSESQQLVMAQQAKITQLQKSDMEQEASMAQMQKMIMTQQATITELKKESN